MNYKLYIKDLAQDWQMIDLGKVLPAMNFQVNNIGELKDRQCDYSQSLTLPPTHNNCKSFGYANEADVPTEIPYRRFDCRLFSNESVIAGKGSYLVLDGFDDGNFKAQILSGNADLFNELGQKKMSELNLGFYQLGSEDFGYQTSDYVIARSKVIRGDSTWSDSTIDKILPFAWLKNAIEKLLLARGFSLVTNLTSADWADKTISCCTKKPSANTFTPFHGSASGSTTSSSSSPRYLSWFTISNNGYNTLFVEPIAGNLYGKLVWKPKINGSGRLTLNVLFNNAGTEIYVMIDSLTETLFEETVVSTTNGEVYDLIQNIDITDSEEITITILNNTTTVASGISAIATINNLWSEEIPVGGNLYISNNMGFETQLDFFKCFVLLFGITVLVDNDQKIVYCYTTKQLYDNKSVAIDWSNKLDTRKKETSFKIEGYAKRNYIAFETYEDELIKLSEKGSFTIDDDKLETEKTLFTIALESAVNYSQKFVTAPLSVAYIPLWTKEVDQVTEEVTYKFEGGKPHICSIDTAITTMYATNIEIQHFVLTYYNKLADMLDQLKKIECSFNLTDEDVEKYKSIQDGMPCTFIPVYINHYGRFFYINKIKNFVSRNLTKCELIKL